MAVTRPIPTPVITPSITPAPKVSYDYSKARSIPTFTQNNTQSIYKPVQNQKATKLLPRFTTSQTKQVNSTGNSSGQVLGTSDTQNTFDYPQYSAPSPQDSGELDMINNEFNSFNSYLDQQEQQANTNFGETKGLYDTQKANAEKQYQTEKATQLGDIKSTEALNLKKVRQLLGELTQGNAARTAISGGGSVSEVLAERFGREAQSRLGNVMDVTQKAIERTNTFYNNAITRLQETYDSNILQAKQALQDNISNISAQRQQPAAAKQQATIGAWKEYYNNVNQAKIQAAQFKAQYDMWKQQQDSALSATAGFNAANTNTFNTGMQNSFSNEALAPEINPQQNQYNTNPYMVTNKKRNTTDEDWWTQNYPDMFPATNAISSYGGQ